MMEAKQIIFQALSTDPALSALLGTDSNGKVKVYTAWHDSSRGYPQVTITRTSELGVYNGDNSRREQATAFQVDIWHRKDPTPIEVEVKRVIKTIGTNPVLARPDQYDVEEKLHRVIYQTTVNQNV